MNIDFILQQAESDYTDLGAYPKYFMCRDGGVLCPQCVRDNLQEIKDAVDVGGSPQWYVVAVDVNWEDPNLYCDHCNNRIPSAYAEPD